jgi:hypothetical protein
VNTLGQLVRKSGGLWFYQEFDVYQHAMKFTNDLYHCITRLKAWDASFKVRTSLGFKQVQVFGNYFKKKDVLYFPVLDSDKLFCIELERLEAKQG